MTAPEQYPRIALLASWRAFHLPIETLTLRGRKQPMTFARQVAWWLLRDVCGWSDAMIASHARRDRSAVTHAMRTVEDRVCTEGTVMDRVMRARSMFILAVPTETQH